MYGVTRKKSKNEKHLGIMMIKNPKMKGAY